MPKFEVVPNEHYEVDSDHFINITEGKFKDFRFIFGELRFQGQDEEGNGRVAFNYDLLSTAEGITLNDELKEEFEQEVGEVLKEIMSEILNKEEDETGDIDTQPTDLL